MAIENQCRLCLRPSAEVSLFGPPTSTMVLSHPNIRTDSAETIALRIWNCCGIQIYLNDGLPDKICFLCSLTLDSIAKFKYTCAENDKILRKKLSDHPILKRDSDVQNQVFKTEPDCEETPSMNNTGDVREYAIYFDNYATCKDGCINKNGTSKKHKGVSKKLKYKMKKNTTTKKRNKCKIKKKHSISKSKGNVRKKSLIKKESKNNIDVDAQEQNSKLENETELMVRINDCKNDSNHLQNFLAINDTSINNNEVDKVFKGNVSKNTRIKKNRINAEKLTPEQNNTQEETPVGYQEIQHQNIVECSIDEKMTMNEDDTEKPMKRIRVRKKNVYVCPVCKETFLVKENFIQHMLCHNNKIDGLECEICGKLFSTTAALKMHKIKHLNPVKIPCDLCGSTFTEKSGLKRHMKNIHLKIKPFQCNICGKLFYNATDCKIHMRIHDTNSKFECDYCGKRVNQKASLASHIRIHTGERPYKCQLCPKSFRILSGLKSHTLQHTGENPFKCEICFKGFKQRCNLKSHMKYNHKQI